MSTLGDLLAEHTVLPGNAVDHLHAVVGEWQLLADLSFADYLMWVRRDDGALVCVAQIRPNTALTVLNADVVGTINASAEMPVVVAAFESGTIGRGNDAAQDNSFGDTRLNVEAVPVRYHGDVVAVLTHQTAQADRRKASPLERAELLRQALDLSGGRHEILLDLIAALLDAGLSDYAAAGLESVPPREQDARWRKLKARLDLASGAGAADDGMLRDRIGADPQDFEARFELATLLAQRGDWRAAFAELLEVVLRDRSDSRTTARGRLVEWFALCPDARAVAEARRQLSMYLN